MSQVTISQEETPICARRSRFLLKRIILFVACGFGAVAVVLLALVVPDQIKTISPPRFERDFLVAAGPDEASGSDSKSNANARMPSFEDYRKMLRPVLNDPPIPERLRGGAEEWNRIQDDLTSQLLSIVLGSKTMNWDEASRALWEIKERRSEVRDRQWEPFFSEKYWIDGNAEGDERVKQDEIWTQVRLRIHDTDDAWNRSFWEAVLIIAIEKEKWEDAAHVSQFLSGIPIPDKDTSWWKIEVYCWRQCGTKGRAALAYRSAQPIAAPIAIGIRRIFKPSDRELMR